MKDGAPTSLTVPQATTQTHFTVDGETLELRHPNDYAAYVWIPANRAIIGGTGVASGIHVWTADTQSAEQRSAWRSVLGEMQKLQPTQVVPGITSANALRAIKRFASHRTICNRLSRR